MTQVSSNNMIDEYYILLNDILRGYNRCTPSNISTLRSNQIFVFGTDTKGSQKYGAAGLAANRFGAEVGVADGPTGMCYALPTMGFTEQDLSHAVVRFEQFVRANMSYTFLVTAIGCGHAGFDVTKVANMFKGLIGLNNVMLPEPFLKVYREECRQYFSLAESPHGSDDDKKDLEQEIFDYYSENVHNVIHYLLEKDIPFNKEGGFTLLDSDEKVIAEAELGIESERVVFYPFNSQSEIAFKNNGYTIMTEIEYLKSK